MFHTMLNFTLSLVNISNLFIKDFTNFSLAGANGSLIKHSFLSSKSHCGINTSSFCWLNLWKTSFMTWIGKPACKYLIFILLVSLLKFDANLLALCRSPVIALRLYLKGILLLQWTGNLLVIIAELCLTNSVSRNFLGFSSIVSLTLSW